VSSSTLLSEVKKASIVKLQQLLGNMKGESSFIFFIIDCCRENSTRYGSKTLDPAMTLGACGIIKGSTLVQTSPGRLLGGGRRGAGGRGADGDGGAGGGDSGELELHCSPHGDGGATMYAGTALAIGGAGAPVAPLDDNLGHVLVSVSFNRVVFGVRANIHTTRALTRRQAPTHSHTYTHAPVHTHSNAHTCTHTHKQHAYKHTQQAKPMTTWGCVSVDMHTYVRTHAHTFVTLTYTHKQVASELTGKAQTCRNELYALFGIWLGWADNSLAKVYCDRLPILFISPPPLLFLALS